MAVPRSPVLDLHRMVDLCYEGAFRSVFDGKFGYGLTRRLPHVLMASAMIANPYTAISSPVTFAHTRSF